jgi:hypothetical protein
MFFPGSTEGKGGSFSQKPNLEVQVERRALLGKNLVIVELSPMGLSEIPSGKRLHKELERSTIFNG